MHDAFDAAKHICKRCFINAFFLALFLCMLKEPNHAWTHKHQVMFGVSLKEFAFSTQLTVDAVYCIHFGYAIFIGELFHLVILPKTEVTVNQHYFAVESFLGLF